MPTAIRACLFDAGNVFITFMERSEVFARIARVAGAPIAPTMEDFVRCKLLLGEHDGTHEGPYGLIDSGQVNWTDIYRKFLQVTGLNESRLSEIRFWATYCRHIDLIPGVVDILEELSDAGVPLVVVSNGEFGSQHAADLVSFHSRVRWTSVVISSQVLCKKPGYPIFKIGVAATREATPDLRAEEMVYVDDIHRYCTAFTTHFPGAHAICFNGAAQPADDLRQALHHLGLPVRQPGELPTTRVQPGFLV